MPEAALSQLRALVGSLREAVLVEDEERRVLLTNAEFCRLFGISAPPEALIGMDCAAAADQSAALFVDPSAWLSRVAEILAGRHTVAAEELTLADGRTFERDFIPAHEGDPRGGHLWVYRDITARKREAEALREQARTARESNDAKGSFLATMSHEIRTPMNAILGMTELAMDAAVSAEQREQLHVVRTNAEHLLHLIDDILDMSKIEAGHMTMAQVGCFIADVCEAVSDAVAPRAFARNVRFLCDVAPDMPPMLVGDPHRLRQVLLNLAGNAVKFTHTGRILVRAEVLLRDTEKVRVAFTVADTGVGIPQEAQDRLFGRFYQVDPSLRRSYGGSGLGLSIAQAIVTLMGGTIEVESTPGAGTTFRVALDFPHPSWPTPQRRLSDRGFPGTIVAIRASDPETAAALEHAAAGLRCLPVILAPGEPLAPTKAVLVFTDFGLGEEALRALAAEAKAAGAKATIVVARPSGEERDFVTALADAVHVAAPVSRRRLAAQIAESTGLGIGDRPAFTPSRGNAVVRPDARVLLAEDNADNRAYAIHTLEAAGFTVVAEADGARALEQAKLARFDVVVTDLEMPGLDGYALTRAIRAYEAELKREPTPILALTAHAMSGTREQCLDAGMTAYLAKPVTPQQMRTAVSQLIDPRPLVLVVDDEPMNRVLVRKLLPHDRFRVIESGTAADGIATALRELPSILLLDLGLPDQDGTQVAIALRKDPRTAALPIVALTGYTGAEVEDRLEKAGVSSYLAKPFRAVQLIEATEKALAARTVRTASAEPALAGA
jgi:protein-histidine pros-kinase